MASSRAAALASAALASSRLAQTYPRASPVPTATLPSRPSRPTDLKGKGREHHEEVLEEDYEEDDGLSSRQRRLSRAARFATTNATAFTNPPKDWSELADGAIKRMHKGQIRIDYMGKLKDQRAGKKRVPKDAQRSVGLHLTTASPFRYAAIASVLRQVRNRLGPDQEGLGVDNGRTWTPTRIVEYSCGVGEGLWAAKEVFGTASESSSGLQSYLGIDTHVPLLRCAMDFVKETMPVSEDTAEDGSPAKEQDVQLNLYGIETRFKPHANTPDFISGSSQETLKDLTQSDDQGTMVLCSYALLTQFADTHRAKFIRTIWKAHPSAEVIVFIEEAHERGFAAIASAREYILGIGAKEFPKETLGFQLKHPNYYDRGLLDEEDLVEAAKGVSGEWHVVAPCPHDKPCPLLHDYHFSGPPNTPTTRTSSASSPLFHGSALGMTICSFSTRLLRSEHTRHAMSHTRPEGAANYSYLVLRRGPRPSIAAEAAQSAAGDKLAAMMQLRRGSQKTKIGAIEEIRAGSQKDSVILGEEINEDDTVEAAPGSIDDAEAKAELLKLLPQALGREMDKEEYKPDMDEAMQMAHALMGKSAHMGWGESIDETSSSGEQSDILLTAGFLDQARQLNPVSETEEVKPLQPSDIEAMKIESYEWPRVIRPAIKKSGHVTFDVCNSSGSIDRFTVSKSSGKQIYQDARKATYGDLFPHVGFSDEEGVEAYTKSLITRVPSAGTERSGLPATFKKLHTKQRYKMKRAERLGSSLPSHMAIGADRVSPITNRPLLEDLAKSRRDHTKGDKGGRSRGEKDEPDPFARHRLTARQELLALE